jgi:hypothetical protein
MARHLRIAGSVLLAVFAVALIALWVRSHHYRDQVFGTVGGTHYFFLFSEWNVVTCAMEKIISADPLPAWELAARPIPFEPMNWGWRRGVLAGLGFKYVSEPDRVSLAVPHWFLAAVSASFAATIYPKKSWRFSLRSMLIATTIFALAIAFGVCMY